jgi:uncharacterized protein YbjQ (UPF0145 family)
MPSQTELSSKYGTMGTMELMDILGIKYESGSYFVGNELFKGFDEALNYADANFGGVIEHKAPTSGDKVRIEDARIRKMPILTLDYFPGREIDLVCGSARGGTVRAKHFGKDIAASLKNLVGGEIKGYTELMAEGREEAIYRMKVDADEMGADAVIGYRFSSAMIDVGATEMLAYGTAVKLRESPKEKL